MGNPPFSIRLTIFLSLSFSLAASSSSTLFFFKPPSSSLSLPPLNSQAPVPKATALDLLSVLGPASQSSAVNPLVAQELKSCFKFLVPFSPDKPKTGFSGRRSLWVVDGKGRKEGNELVWWPPEPVLELARLAVDSGGNPDAIHQILDPSVIPELNSYLGYLFELIVDRGPSVGLNVSLNRYDFFHGHLFVSQETGRLGILFHAKEYPAYDDKVFPYNMGFCQKGSDVRYDDSMNLRNILWLAPLPGNSNKGWVAPGVLVVLDARPGGIIYRDIIPEYVRFARTIYEDDLGDVVVDVNYLNVGDSRPDYQIFIC
ncbi:uncharacterized protein LOC110815472 isoform X2 [Carica papaya]|uniref:uncharacterized protein LOC110815472 isoform X2 n=1 Tax=Carica papaya TaxID=3649 RepID=UPI000B8CF5F4|nr:uncharacterized protein LOC110815472 isoform X2 [Carica papaya]